MAHELRNLPHIASMAFNEPLMLEPAYARVFFCALAGSNVNAANAVMIVLRMGVDFSFLFAKIIIFDGK